MSNAYIRLVSESNKQMITTKEVMDYFHYYRDITSKTGKQVNWDYETSSFPYEITESMNGDDQCFYLKSHENNYNIILLGVDSEQIKDEDGSIREQFYIQVTLPETSTSGDKGKANEFCKFLAKKLEGELQLFNGRIMYYYPRK